MTAALWILAFGALASFACAADAAKPSSVPPSDDRFTHAYDLDHPFSFHPRFKSEAEWEKRAQSLREQILVSLGLWPLPERAPLHAVVHGKIERDGYTVEKVFFASYPGHYVSGNLYRPIGKSGKLPGILSPHGHWNNGRFYENSEEGARREIETGAEKTMEGARYPLQARCAMLARMGCVVFHYDMVGVADSRQIPHREGFADAEAELRLQSFMGLQAWNSVRALDFLESLPDVDPKRIGVTGASGGGTQTFILCAIDPRPAVAFPAVMVSGDMQGGCVCENSSLLRVDTNNIEIAALFAPKPLGMTGANDWTRDIETKGLPELKEIYGLYGAAGNVDAKYYPFEHNYNQVSRERMYEWMNRQLHLGWPEPVTEKPFAPVPPAELSVYDGAHPLPKDASDAAGLRRALTEASDRRMAELARHPDAYRRVVRIALQAMICDSLPTKDDAPAFRSEKSRRGEGYAAERGIFPALGDRPAVRATRWTPEKWNGKLILWADPQGSAGLEEESGNPRPAARRILESGAAILAPDLFDTGDAARRSGPPAVMKLLDGPGRSYAGFAFGYNRSLLAERARDLLTVIAAARDMDGVKSLALSAPGEAGTRALIAAALSGGAIQRAALDLNGFDFDQIRSVADENMLPGALKYGGVYGFAALLEGKTILYHAPKEPETRKIPIPSNVTVSEEKRSADRALDALLEE
jgi:dienelactone hydrolase